MLPALPQLIKRGMPGGRGCMCDVYSTTWLVMILIAFFGLELGLGLNFVKPAWPGKAFQKAGTLNITAVTILPVRADYLPDCRVCVRRGKYCSWGDGYASRVVLAGTVVVDGETRYYPNVFGNELLLFDQPGFPLARQACFLDDTAARNDALAYVASLRTPTGGNATGVLIDPQAAYSAANPGFILVSRVNSDFDIANFIGAPFALVALAICCSFCAFRCPAAGEDVPDKEYEATATADGER